MGRTTTETLAQQRPAWAAYVELTKPITWFPPMFAFVCGVVSAGPNLAERWPFAVGGILLAGPLICGTSQIVNDWFDRHVDAINQPERAIPSGRVPGRNGLYFAIIWTIVSFLVATTLGVWVTAAAAVGIALAWMYSAPPFRLKQNGWWGNAACGLCYEGLPWFTAAAALIGGFPDATIITLALLYSAGTHGIMTLNDFKAIEGDKVMGIRSLPVQLGANGAAKLTCLIMLIPQFVVIALVAKWQQELAAYLIAALVLAQALLMRRFLRSPIENATWFSSRSSGLFVLGMLVSAFAVRGFLSS